MKYLRGFINGAWPGILGGLVGGVVAFCLSSCPTRAQTMCQNLGDGFTSCTNGASSQRIGEFDYNSDGSWGMRLGGGMYLANPPANPRADAPAVPIIPEPQPFEVWRQRGTRK